MTNETTENFLKTRESYVWNDPSPVFYRAYFDDQGWVVCYTMEDLPGNYIDIDVATYTLGPTHARVIDNKLVVVPRPVTILKLTPDHSAGTACDPRDVCVIVDKTRPYTLWNIKTNELNT
jgi:hypothetical protein